VIIIILQNCNNTIKKDLNNKYYKCNPNYLQYELNNKEKLKRTR